MTNRRLSSLSVAFLPFPLTLLCWEMPYCFGVRKHNGQCIEIHACFDIGVEPVVLCRNHSSKFTTTSTTTPPSLSLYPVSRYTAGGLCNAQSRLYTDILWLWDDAMFDRAAKGQNDFLIHEGWVPHASQEKEIELWSQPTTR